GRARLEPPGVWVAGQKTVTRRAWPSQENCWGLRSWSRPCKTPRRPCELGGCWEVAHSLAEPDREMKVTLIIAALLILAAAAAAGEAGVLAAGVSAATEHAAPTPAPAILRVSAPTLLPVATFGGRSFRY